MSGRARGFPLLPKAQTAPEVHPTSNSRAAMGTTACIKQLGRADDRFLEPRALVKNEWICTSIPCLDFTACTGVTVHFTSDIRS
jgi:hypothetical protein